MVAGKTDTLPDLIGSEIWDRTDFQWRKLIGHKNLMEGYSALVVKSEFITQEFHRCKEQGSTSRQMATLLLYYYRCWASMSPNCLLKGRTAEIVHDAILNRIATYHKVNWHPEKHKKPSNGIFNMFNSIRATRQWLQLSTSTETRVQKHKMSILLHESVEDVHSMNHSGSDPETQPQGAYLGVELDWDSLIVPTPEDIFLSNHPEQNED